MNQVPPRRRWDPGMIDTINRAYASAVALLARSPSLVDGMADSEARASLGRAMMELVERGITDEATLVWQVFPAAFPGRRLQSHGGGSRGTVGPTLSLASSGTRAREALRAGHAAPSRAGTEAT